jgi:nitroreductase
MDNTTIGALYEELFRRKSVRRYESRMPEGEDAGKDAVDAAINAVVPLNDSPAALRVVPAEEAGVSFGKAPCCLCGYAKHEDAAQLNAAFMLQEASLRLSCLGLGSCWLGMAKPKGDHAEYQGLPFFKLLVFGYPAETLHRTADGFNRKPRAEITGIGDEDALTEALRIAPSAMNRQGWFLSRSGNRIRLYMADNNFLLKRLMDSLTTADAGIALCHLRLAAQHQGRFRSALHEEGVPPIRRNYSYVWTIELT